MMRHAWLVLWLALTAASAGGIAWDAIHRLTGGAWGVTLSPWFRRLRALLPLAAMVGLPLLFSAAALFPWLREPVDEARRWYLSFPGLAWRTIACFLTWAGAWWLLSRAPALSLVAWLLACSVFANDWIVSLWSDWRSAAIGLVYALAQLSLAMSTALLGTWPDDTPVATRRDIASIVFALCLGWGYLAGVDYLTAWSSDLPYEAAWYLPRTQGRWAVVVVAAVWFQLLVPFALLLVRSWKGSRAVLRVAGASVFIGQVCHLAWMTMP